MASRWLEEPPMGPTQAGDVGGDIQAGEAFSRRWSRPNPGRSGWMVITVTQYACEERARRWVQTQIEFATAPRLLDDLEPFDTRYEDSHLDGPAGADWPTDEDVRDELAGYDITIHDAWDGTPT